VPLPQLSRGTKDHWNFREYNEVNDFRGELDFGDGLLIRIILAWEPLRGLLRRSAPNASNDIPGSERGWSSVPKSADAVDYTGGRDGVTRFHSSSRVAWSLMSIYGILTASLCSVDEG
jgi:hypothetical protein